MPEEATLAPHILPEQRMLLRHVRWETYERLLKDFENSSSPHLNYDRGTLEIMRPLPEHERRNRAIASLVEVLAEEWGIETLNLGSTTFRRKDILRGFEPDSCFYIQNVARVRTHGGSFDLDANPPPDLVIEIDLTHPSLDTFPIYAPVGVPEIWRDAGDTITIFERNTAAIGEEYLLRAESPSFPGLTASVLTEFIASSQTLGRLAWLRSVRAWARDKGPA